MRYSACPPRRCLEGLHILVVDDDDDLREALIDSVLFYGASADGSASAADARQRLAAARYDLLLSDLNMPDEDGCTLIAGLRAAAVPELRQIRAAAVTAEAEGAGGHDALAAGFDRVISKSVGMFELVRAVRELADLPR